MTLEIALVLGILVVALVLFVSEWLRMDLVALLAQGRLDRFKLLQRWSTLVVEREAPKLPEPVWEKTALAELVLRRWWTSRCTARHSVTSTAPVSWR